MEATLRLRLNLALHIPRVSRQQIALPAVFGLIGLLLGSWASRIPAVQEGLQISHSVLSLVLLCAGVGGVLAHPIASFMLARQGGRKSILYAGLGLCSVLVAIGKASSVSWLMLAVLMLGLIAGAMGIVMNSVATQYEKTSGKSRLSMLHACGCAGSLAGALIGSYVASLDVAPSVHFFRIAILSALMLWAAYQLLDADEGGIAVEEKKKFTLPSSRLALLGVLGFFAVLSENTIAVWSGMFLKEQFNVTAGFAPLALSAFTVMMLLSRLFGDKLKEQHGARRLIVAGAGISAAGLFLAVFASNPYLALAGFAGSGMGLSLVFPFIVSAVGKEGPLALTGVVTIINLNGVMGPPIVGTMADYLGMQATIGFVGLLSIVISLVAARSTMLK
jgi:MFS family permease